jgi:hypothetical protein
MSISKPTDGMGIFCTRCNAEMDADATFCPVCGEPRLLAADSVVTRDEPTRVIEETVYDEPAPVLVEERPTVPPWLAALLGILATLVIVLLIVVFAQSDDDNQDGDTTTTVPTTVPITVATVPSPSIVTVPVPVVVTPAPTQPPATAPPTVATVTTAAP